MTVENDGLPPPEEGAAPVPEPLPTIDAPLDPPTDLLPLDPQAEPPAADTPTQGSVAGDLFDGEVNLSQED